MTDLSEYQIGYDYKGTNVWKRSVAISALHTDYLMHGPPVNRITFMVVLRRALGDVDKKSRYGWLHTPRGYRFLRPRRNHIVFKSLTYHRLAASFRYASEEDKNANQNEKNDSSDNG